MIFWIFLFSTIFYAFKTNSLRFLSCNDFESMIIFHHYKKRCKTFETYDIGIKLDTC